MLPGAPPETRAQLFPPAANPRTIVSMSNTAARWTLVATLATTTLLTAAITTRLSAAPTPTPSETQTQTIHR